MVLGGVVALAGCGGGGEGASDAGHYVVDGGAGDGGVTFDAGGDTFSPVDGSHDGTATVQDGGGEAEAAAPKKLVAYASGYGPDIQWLTVDAASGALAASGSVASFGTAPSFLAVDGAGKHLYAVDEATPGRVGAYTVDAASGALTFLGAVASGGDGPPFVTAALAGWVLVANYTSGTVAVLPVAADGSLGAATDTQSPGALAHMIVPDPSGKFVFVPCKGADYVAQYVFDGAKGKLTPNAVPRVATAAGAGPRHLAFHPNGALAYVIDENDSTMIAMSFDAGAGTLTPIQTVPTTPPGFTGTNTGAEVHVHPSGKWLFGSNRGDDSIVVFALDAAGKMTAHGFTKTGGKTPRDFALDPTGTFLYAANQDSGTVVTFRFDASAGTLTPTGNTVTVASASYVGLLPLP